MRVLLHGPDLYTEDSHQLQSILAEIPNSDVPSLQLHSSESLQLFQRVIVVQTLVVVKKQRLETTQHEAAKKSLGDTTFYQEVDTFTYQK